MSAARLRHDGRSVFEDAPVLIWEEDFSAIWDAVQQLRSSGVTDLAACTAAHPEIVAHWASLIRVLHVNKAARVFYGAPSEAELIRRLPELLDDSSLPVLREEIIAFASGRTSFAADVQTRTCSGDHRLARMNVTIVPGSGRPWSNVLVAFTDLTERQRMEEKLHEYASALQRSNEELRRLNADLNHFASVAAHDLREPLRTIALHAQVLKRDSVAVLSEKCSRSLGFIIDGALRMDGMVRDLLSFARAIESPVSDAPLRTDANAAISDVTQALSAAITETCARISVPVLPDVAVRPVHLTQIFQNLIANAIKYRHPDRPPVVQISAERTEDVVVFRVQDNGSGIENEYQNQIFGLFSRLHGNNIEGSGIGLALCRKIVNHYGGTISVESVQGEGSTFTFGLPIAAAPWHVSLSEALRFKKAGELKAAPDLRSTHHRLPD